MGGVEHGRPLVRIMASARQNGRTQQFGDDAITALTPVGSAELRRRRLSITANQRREGFTREPPLSRQVGGRQQQRGSIRVPRLLKDLTRETLQGPN